MLVLLFSYLVTSISLGPHELQHARLPCPSLSPRVCSNSCPDSCHPTISSSVAPFSSCPQSFPASGSFPMSRLSGQSIWSFSFSVSPSSEYSGLISFRIDWFDLLAVHQRWISIIVHLLKPTEYRTLRMYPKVCHGLWAIMI